VNSVDVLDCILHDKNLNLVLMIPIQIQALSPERRFEQCDTTRIGKSKGNKINDIAKRQGNNSLRTPGRSLGREAGIESS
jgi:hypothetical protein